MGSNWIVSILIFILILGVIVISHEFGHYSVARRAGIRVNEFDIGFGPVLYKKRIGETDFCVKLLPIGGACLFEGEDGLYDEEDGSQKALAEDAFPNAPVGARIATVLAGPVANFLIGYLFALILVAFSGSDLPVIDTVIEDSAAMEAGLMDGDRIVKINGESIHLYREVSLQSMMNYGEPLEITYERDGKRTTVTLTPRYDEEAKRYYIGIMGAGSYHKCSAPEVFVYGNTTYTEASPYGPMVVILSLLNLATLLTVNLGIFNLLPLPALDGGRLVFLLVEAVRGKPVPPDKEGMVHLAGFMALMALMVLVMFNDISHFFH